MDIDPIASLRCWEIEVRVNGQNYTIPSQPAADWLPPLMEVSPMDIVPGMIVGGAELDDAIIDGSLSVDDLIDAAYDAIEQASGMNHWPAMVIARILRENWENIGGRLLRDGFRFDVQSLGSALSATHNLVLERLGRRKEDEQRLNQYLATLDSSGPTTSRQGKSRAVADFAEAAGPVPASALPSEGAPPKTPKRPPARPPRVQSSSPSSQPEKPARSGLRSKSRPNAAGPASGRTSR